MNLFNPLGAEAWVFQLALEEPLSGHRFSCFDTEITHHSKWVLSMAFYVSFARAEDVSSPCAGCTWILLDVEALFAKEIIKMFHILWKVLSHAFLLCIFFSHKPISWWNQRECSLTQRKAVHCHLAVSKNHFVQLCNAIIIHKPPISSKRLMTDKKT